MRVVFVGAYPGLRGSARSLARLLNGLRTQSLEAHVVWLSDGPAPQAMAQQGFETEIVSAPSRSRFGGASSRTPVEWLQLFHQEVRPARLRLRALLRRIQPAILHCNDTRSLLISGPVAKRLGIPVLWHLRQDCSHYPWWSRSLARRSADAAIVVSEGLQRPLGRSRPVHVVANATEPVPDPQQLAEVRAQLSHLKARYGVPPDGQVLVTASAPVPFKGLRICAKALARLKAEHPAVASRLLWVVLGEPVTPLQRDYFESLRDEVHGLDLESSVHFHGPTDVPMAWMSAADLVALPSTPTGDVPSRKGRVQGAEGCPRVLLEAMAVGTPVVASNLPGVRELLVEGACGRLVDAGSVEQLCTAVHELLSDPVAADRLASAASLRVRDFSLERQVGKVIEVYERLCR